MTSRTVMIWIVLNEAGDYEVAADKDAAVDRWNDEFLEEDVMGPPEYRFVKLNVTMSEPLGENGSGAAVDVMCLTRPGALRKSRRSDATLLRHPRPASKALSLLRRIK